MQALSSPELSCQADLCLPGNRLGDLPALTAHDRIVAVLEDPTRSPKGGAVKRARTSWLCGSANASNGLEDLMLKQGLLNPLESYILGCPTHIAHKWTPFSPLGFPQSR